MAKVTDIKFEIGGANRVIHINCNSSGTFSANIPEDIYTALGLPRQIQSKSMSEVSKQIHDGIRRFKEAETTQELYIAIRYAACGKYSLKSDGSALYFNRSHYYLEVSNWEKIEALGFYFAVVIKETIDGNVVWYHAKKEGELSYISHDFVEGSDKYIKQDKFVRIEKYKTIPYSEAAHGTLLAARETIRKASELLFNFIEQDEKLIEATLLNQKLLS